MKNTALLLSGEVAHALRLSPVRVRQLADSGRLKVAATTPGGVRLFLQRDVLAFQRSREKAGAAR